jgi:glutathione S-transferase
MLKFYYNTAPNPMKVALFLEESGLPYEPVPVDTRKGEQHKPAYLAINPNAKAPSIVDGEVTVFDSNAILLYLAEKTGKFLPDNTPIARGQMLSWLMFVATGVGPFSGQAVHFKAARTGEASLRNQPLFLRGRTSLRNSRHTPREAPLHAGGPLHDCRHGCLGLGAIGPVRTWRGGVVEDAESQTARR